MCTCAFCCGLPGTQHVRGRCSALLPAGQLLLLLQLCHFAAVTTAQRGEGVMYFDTTNGFSAARAKQLYQATYGSTVSAVYEQKFLPKRVQQSTYCFDLLLASSVVARAEIPGSGCHAAGTRHLHKQYTCSLLAKARCLELASRVPLRITTPPNGLCAWQLLLQ